MDRGRQRVSCAGDSKLRVNRITPPVSGCSSRSRSAGRGGSLDAEHDGAARQDHGRRRTPWRDAPSLREGAIRALRRPRGAHAAASRISAFICRTASRMPTKTARETIAWPMCSSRTPGQCRDRLHVEVVERVPGVEAHAQPRIASPAARIFASSATTAGLARVAPLRVERVRVRPGVDLADRGADARRRLDLADVRVDEHAHARCPPRPAAPPRRQGAPPAATMSSPPSVVISCRPSGTSMAISGLSRAGDADHLVGRRHLEVQLDVDELAQAAHVLVLDVAAVLAQVHGDAVGAAQVRLDGGPHGIGLVGAARLPQRRHVVDVDAELDHGVRSLFALLVERLQVLHDAAALDTAAARGNGRARRASAAWPRRPSRRRT